MEIEERMLRFDGDFKNYGSLMKKLNISKVYVGTLESLIPKGIEPRISGSKDQRVIHWAMGPRCK